MKNLGLFRGNVDPCLYVKKCEKGIVYVALYTGNMMMLGGVEAINEAIRAIKEMGYH